MPVEVHRTPEGAVVVVDGEVRATFVGDLDRPEDRAALDELVRELFGEPGAGGAGAGRA